MQTFYYMKGLSYVNVTLRPGWRPQEGTGDCHLPPSTNGVLGTLIDTKVSETTLNVRTTNCK